MPPDAPEQPIDILSIHLPEHVGLVVVWRRSTRLDGGEITINDKVAEFLRTAGTTTIEKLGAGDRRSYDAQMHLEQEEVLQVFDPTLLAESPLKPVLFPEHPLTKLNARNLPSRALLLYAAVFLLDGRRWAFVRKANPHYGVRPGRIFALLGNTLTAVAGSPVFTLDPEFDMIVSEDGLVVASDQNVFEVLFKDTEVVLGAVPLWIASIADHLPISGNGGEVLTRMAERDSRVRRRLRSIHTRGHLAFVTIENVREYIIDQGLEEESLISGDELVVDEHDPTALLAVLSEDLFKGGLTGARFRSDRKALR